MPKEQIAIRLPDGLLARLDTRAAQVGLSRNEWTVRALTWALEQPPTTRTREEVI